MTPRRIEQLVDLLPDGANYRQRVPSDNYDTSEVRDQEANLLAYALKDLRFGWHYVKSFVNDDLMLPNDAHDQWIRRAFEYEYYGFHDHTMRAVFALDSPHNRNARDLVKALLVIPDLSFDQIAKILFVETRVVQAFEQLFFNVRDRIHDKVFMASITFPDGIQTEFQEKLNADSLDSMMLRAAATGGPDLVFAVAGMGGSRTADYDPGAAARDFESLIMTNARNLARLGMLNQQDVPGIMHARNIVSASKHGGAQPSTTPARGLAQLSMGGSIVSQVMEICGGADPGFRKMAEKMLKEELGGE